MNERENEMNEARSTLVVPPAPPRAQADRQYVRARFSPTGREYTWHNDGEAVRVGDFVKVETAREHDGWSRVEVVKVWFGDPPKGFATKPILGKVEA